MGEDRRNEKDISIPDLSGDERLRKEVIFLSMGGGPISALRRWVGDRYDRKLV